MASSTAARSRSSPTSSSSSISRVADSAPGEVTDAGAVAVGFWTPPAVTVGRSEGWSGSTAPSVAPGPGTLAGPVATTPLLETAELTAQITAMSSTRLTTRFTDLFTASTPAAVLAEIQADVLVRSFVIGLLIVIPIWLHKRRRLQRSTTARTTTARTTTGGVDEPHPPRLEDVVAQVDEVARTAADEGTATLTVPDGVTIDGHPADPGTVDALVRDALRRSGLVAVAELDSRAGRTLECRPIGGGS